MCVDISSTSSSKQPTPKSREGNSSSSSASSPPTSKPRQETNLNSALPASNIDLESPSRRIVRSGLSSADSGRVSQGSMSQLAGNSAVPATKVPTDVDSSSGVVLGSAYPASSSSSKIERTSHSGEDSPMIVLQHPTVTSH